MKKSLVFSAFLLGLCYVLQAQNSFNSGAKDTTSQMGTISYSIGQIFYQHTDAIHQGVHQPYRIESTKITPEWEKANIEVFFAYPNPTQGILTLRFTGEILQNFALAMFDINGRKIVEQSLKNQETTIDLSNFKSGVYILRITQQNKEVSVMRIIKQ